MRRSLPATSSSRDRVCRWAQLVALRLTWVLAFSFGPALFAQTPAAAVPPAAPPDNAALEQRLERLETSIDGLRTLLDGQDVALRAIDEKLEESPFAWWQQYGIPTGIAFLGALVAAFVSWFVFHLGQLRDTMKLFAEDELSRSVGLSLLEARSRLPFRQRAAWMALLVSLAARLIKKGDEKSNRLRVLALLEKNESHLTKLQKKQLEEALIGKLSGGEHERWTKLT